MSGSLSIVDAVLAQGTIIHWPLQVGPGINRASSSGACPPPGVISPWYGTAHLAPHGELRSLHETAEEALGHFVDGRSIALSLHSAAFAEFKNTQGRPNRWRFRMISIHMTLGSDGIVIRQRNTSGLQSTQESIASSQWKTPGFPWATSVSKHSGTSTDSTLRRLQHFISALSRTIGVFF